MKPEAHNWFGVRPESWVPLLTLKIQWTLYKAILHICPMPNIVSNDSFYHSNHFEITDKIVGRPKYEFENAVTTEWILKSLFWYRTSDSLTKTTILGIWTKHETWSSQLIWCDAAVPFPLTTHKHREHYYTFFKCPTSNGIVSNDSFYHSNHFKFQDNWHNFCLTQKLNRKCCYNRMNNQSTHLVRDISYKIKNQEIILYETTLDNWTKHETWSSQPIMINSKVASSVHLLQPLHPAVIALSLRHSLHHTALFYLLHVISLTTQITVR